MTKKTPAWVAKMPRRCGYCNRLLRRRRPGQRGRSPTSARVPIVSLRMRSAARARSTLSRLPSCAATWTPWLQRSASSAPSWMPCGSSGFCRPPRSRLRSSGLSTMMGWRSESRARTEGARPRAGIERARAGPAGGACVEPVIIQAAAAPALSLMCTPGPSPF